MSLEEGVAVVGKGNNIIGSIDKGDLNDTLTQNSDGTQSFKSPVQSSGRAWRSEGGTTAPPSSGKIRWNNASQLSATKLFFSNTDADGVDITNFINQVQINDAFYIQNQGDSNQLQYWGVTGITDQGTYQEYDVTLIQSEGADFSNTGQGTKLLTSYRPGGLTTANLQSGTSGIESGSPTLETPAFEDYDAIYDVSTGLAKLTDFKRINDLLNGENTRAINAPAEWGTPVGGVYTLSTANFTYEYSKDIFIGNNRIHITEPGVSFRGKNGLVSAIISTTTGAVITCDHSFTMSNMAIVGSGTATCCIDATDAGVDTINLREVAFIGATDCGVHVDNYKSFVCRIANFDGMPRGIKFSTTANNTIMEGILFENITTCCIDLNGATTKAMDIVGCTADLATGQTFIKGMANGGNILANGYGTIRANKIDLSGGGDFSDNISPLDTDWELVGNSSIPDSDRLNPQGFSLHVDDGTSTIVVGDASWTQLTVDGSALTNEGALPDVIKGTSQHLWQTSDNTVRAITENDTYGIRIDFTIDSTGSNPQRINVYLDITGATPVDVGASAIIKKSITLKAGVPQDHSLEMSFFTGATFLANGGRIWLRCDSGSAVIGVRGIYDERRSSGAR